MSSRLASFLLVVAVLAVALAVVIGAGSGTGSYQAAAIFDSAEGMVPGQLVKVAGARVGTVTAVKLIAGAPAPSALIEFRIDRDAGPFHADARCQILPEGLISENYVQCDPGSASAPALARSSRHGLPTVPLARTSVPVSLQDVLNIFSLPVDERLSVLINELGIGTAGRGTDINAILRRANPALQQGDRVLSVLDAQDHQIGDAVAQTRAVLGQLAAHAADVRGFVRAGASVASTLATHQASLQKGVAQLPRLLSLLRTNLVPVDHLARDGGPLLDDLRAAAPGLTALTHTLPAFVAPGRPAVTALGAAAARGIPAAAATTPVARQLGRLGATAPGTLRPLAQLLVSSRDSGAFEGLLRLFYSLSTDSAGYDSTSHFVDALIIPFATCIADAALPGCSHAYNAPAQGSVPINGALSAGQPASAIRQKPGPTDGARSRSGAHSAPAAPPPSVPAAPPAAPGGQSNGTSGTSAPPSVPQSLAGAVKSLLTYLLK